MKSKFTIIFLLSAVLGIGFYVVFSTKETSVDIPVNTSWKVPEAISVTPPIVEEVAPDTVNITVKSDNINRQTTFVYSADIHQGTIGCGEDCNDDPFDNIFIVPLKQQPRASDRVWLEYELDGLADHASVARSINSSQSLGGRLVTIGGQPTGQREQIAAHLLREGANVIRFSVPEESELSYTVRNVRLVVDKADEQHAIRGIQLTVPELANGSDKVYIKGFIQGDDYHKANITIGNEPIVNTDGEFEHVVSKPVGMDGNWIVNVRAVFPDGELFNTPFVVAATTENNIQHIEFLSQPKGLKASKIFSTEEENHLSFEGASITTPVGALSQVTDISITALRAIDLPSLPTGMVNVTGTHKGFRFLPHGTAFSADAEIQLPYDTTLIPQGYTAEDIRTFYFDEWERQWVQLPLDTVNSELLAVISTTTHFTDMINGIIKVPESPETQGYTPTMMTDVKAADPSSGVVVIDAPQANNMGSASLSFPFKLPTGRAGMQPQLGLQYNSGGGNGWLGLGWDMNIPAIGIDVQWGTPRYDAGVETETYTLFGEQLFPLAHRGTPQPRVAEKTFNLRVEGSFDRIVRHGNNPTNYWWEVTGKTGIRYFYGGVPSSGISENAVLRSADGNIAHWALTEMRDANDNFARYEYEVRQHTGVAGGTVPGRQLYLSRITYTGHGQTQGVYSVRFISAAGRPDVQIAANLGFKQVTAELLREVEIRYQNELIRSYKLEYKTGAFFKTLLKSVAEYDSENKLFYQHDFDYYDDVKAADGYVPYAPEETYSAEDDGLDGGFTISLDGFKDKMSLLSGSKSWGAGGGLYAGAGLGVNVLSKERSAGVTYNYSYSESEGVIALVDINGDGLPDKVFKKGSNLYFRPNMGGTGFGDAVRIEGINSFSYSSTNSHDLGAAVYTRIAHAGYSHTWSNSKIKIYFSDFNGDGLMDIACNNRVYFNRLENGVPTFKTISTGTPAPLVGSGVIDPSLLPDTEEEQRELEAAFPLHDVVRVWEAPADGIINVTAPAQLFEDTSEEALKYEKKDGVWVNIQFKGTVLWKERIEANDYSIHTPSGVNGLQVKKGDRLYFRVQSVLDGAYDLVLWDPEIVYTSFDNPLLKLTATDYNGVSHNRYRASEDFTVYGRQDLPMPKDGRINITAPFRKEATGDSVRVEMVKVSVDGNTETVIYSKGYADTETANETLSVTNFSVLEDESFYFRIVSKNPVRWEAMIWLPEITYLSADDNSVVLDENNNPLIRLACSVEAVTMWKTYSMAGGHPVKMLGVRKTASDFSLTSEWDAYQHYVDSIKALPKDTIRLFEGEEIYIKPSLLAGGTTSFSDMDMVMKVRGKGNNFSQQLTIVVSSGNILPDDSIRVAPMSDDELWVEYYCLATGGDYFSEANLNKLKNLRMGYTLAGFKGEGMIYGEPDNGYMGTFYRGWGQFAYNGNGNRAALPMIEAELKPVGRPEPSEEDIENWTDPDNPDAYKDIPEQPKPSEDGFIVMIPDGPNRAWVGYDLQTYVKSDRISSSRFGKKDVRVDPFDTTPIGSSLFAWDKINKNESDGVAASVGLGPVGFGGNYAWGTSLNQTDMMDLNGDRYPDLVKEKEIRYTDFDGNPQLKADNDFVHTSKSKTSGLSSNGSIVPSKSTNTSNTAGTKAESSSETAKISLGLNGGVGENSDEAEHTYMDINGDGLPDRVYKNGDVSLNMGYSFAAKEPWGFTSIHSGEGESFSAGLGVSLRRGSIQAGAGLSRNENYNNTRMMDVNGDGLPDRLTLEFNLANHSYAAVPTVRLNTGSGFAPPIVWLDAYSAGKSRSTGQSINTGITFGFTILIGKVVFSPSAFTNFGSNYEESTMMDFDGDGFPDCVYSTTEDAVRIKRSTIGRTNLLRSVNRPFGADFTLDYERTGNTYEQPHSQWALSEVRMFDGYTGDGVDSTLTTFAYEGGYYDRNERRFYGYKTVTTRQHNMDDPNRTEYRRVEQTYENDSYYTKGMLQAETLLAGADTLSRTSNGYVLRDIQTGDALPAGFRNFDNGAAFAALMTTANTAYEAGGSITTRQRFGYDVLGNVTDYTDFADGQPADRVDVRITYHDNNSVYLKALPRTQQVITAEGVVRENETSIDNRGNITQIRQTVDANSAKAVYDMTYDGYGNLTKITRPANYKGERMYFEYTYDPVLHRLPVMVRDAFGYSSSSVYEYTFGTPTETTDLNGHKMLYSIDLRGRATTITAPDDVTAGKPYTIQFEYVTEAANPYAVTRHAMPEGNEVVTYTFVDGAMRPLQVKKTGALFTGEGEADRTAMIVSGWNVYDGFGRTVETYQSIVEELGSETAINTARNAIAPTYTNYDTKDRAVKVTLPDGAVSENGTRIITSPPALSQGEGATYLVTEQKDPLGNVTKTYTDAKGRQRALGQVLDGEEIITLSAYNAIGEVLEVVNAKGETTTYVYDMLGRNLSVDHPDAGLTELEYDNANNLRKKITPNLREMGSNMAIEYKYDYTRLAEIVYPKNVQNYVQYTYGAPGAEYNRAGWLVLVEDASGGRELFYDNMGNVTKEIRSVLVSGGDLRTYISESEYDTWGRIRTMTYPDGEVVTYQYNEAGNLRDMYSEKENRRYEIVRQLGYNEDEQRVFKWLGNGTKTTYSYEPERKRLAMMAAGSGNTPLFDTQYSYDAVDNVLGITSTGSMPVAGLGGNASHAYVYDGLNRLVSASGSAKTKAVEGNYTLAMEYDKLYNITRKNQFSSLDAGKTHDMLYLYADERHPNAPSQIGDKHYTYDANGNPTVVKTSPPALSTGEGAENYRRMVWDEENRLMLLSDNGNGNSYIYDHAGERVIKCQTGLQNMYIDGLPAGMLQSNMNFTVYVSPNMVVRKDGFTKHYYAGTERVLSKLGSGSFNNRFTATNKVITAGNKNYLQRQAQLQKGLDDYYRELMLPPGNPTKKNSQAQPETTGRPLPTVTVDYDIPRGWPREPKFNPPGGPPGPPIQFGEMITNDNATAGYGYVSGSLAESDQYFYHPDHIGSTSIITDANGVATQFVVYMPFGESFVDEHSSRREMPYKFSGKERDEETGLSYFGARYYDAGVGIWYGVDPLAGKYPNVGGYVYVLGNPIRLIDPDGRQVRSSTRPTFRYDDGFSRFPKEKPTFNDFASYRRWMQIATIAYPLMPDGSSAYFHYMRGSGNPYTFNLGKYLRKDPSGQTLQQTIINTAKSNAERVLTREGTASYYSEGFSVGNTIRFPYPATENWQKAVGAFNVYYHADLSVVQNEDNSLTYTLNIILYGEDKYNFNPGQADIASGTPDSVNGRFEVVGLAKEFMQSGSVELAPIIWTVEPREE